MGGATAAGVPPARAAGGTPPARTVWETSIKLQLKYICIISYIQKYSTLHHSITINFLFYFTSIAGVAESF